MGDKRLRRHRLIRHDQIYVPRAIDDDITAFARTLYPSHLSQLAKRHTHGSSDFTARRAAPKQLCVIRDLSGSGKTTLAVQIACQRDQYFGIAKAALQPFTDDILEVLEAIGNGYGFQQLLAADRSVIYVVDSLDEATLAPNKHKEIRSLLRAIDELNNVAVSRDLLCFPLGVVFTVREDFWREWESLFEGAPVNTFLKRFSYFLPDQTKDALVRYSDAYGFRLTGPFDKTSLRVLSHPFNLLIFAEANEYRGDVSPHQVLDENVLALYFERKKEDILNRPIPGFMPSVLLLVILSRIALRAAEQAENNVSHDAFCDDISCVSPSLSEVSNEIVRVIVSEQILVRDPEDIRKYRFRHMRFIEYLVAYHIASQLSKNRDPTELDLMVRQYVRGDFLSLYYVHEFIRFICKTNFIDLYEALTDFYSASAHYVERLLMMRRADIAAGDKTTHLDIDTIKKAAAAGNADVCWNAFFVIAARNNSETREAVLSAFTAAWIKNEHREDRWKLLAKVAQHGLILHETVFGHLITSENAKDWFVFIDEVIECEVIGAFGKVWSDAGGENLLKIIAAREGVEWRRVAGYLRLLLKGQTYERGASS